MTNKICKIIPWEDRQDLIDVIESRKNGTVLKSSLPVHENFIVHEINRLDIFDHNLVTGLYIDNVLDCFMYLDIWPELHTYSHIVFTRYNPDGREKYPNTKHDKNLIELSNYTLNVMESKGYYNFYNLVQDTDWEPFHSNENARVSLYNRVVVEEIPAGKISASSVFRRRLSGRVFDAPTKVVFLSLPMKLRNNA